jgi:hypothetical protein
LREGAPSARIDGNKEGVADADHGIADQAVLRGITAAATSNGPERALAL